MSGLKVYLRDLLYPHVVADTDSDEEFLSDLVTSPPGSTPLTLSVLRSSSHQATKPAPREERTRKRPVESRQQGPRQRLKKNESGRIPCIGCPDEMAAKHGELWAGTRLNGQLSDAGILLFFRHNIFDATLYGMKRVAPNLCARIESLVQQRGICIFKIGITQDPYHRMYNAAYGYTRRGELYDRMDLLVASYPAVCACLETLCIERMKNRRGCRNDAPGGENPPESGICYLYVVSLPCGDGRRIPTR